MVAMSRCASDLVHVAHDDFDGQVKVSQSGAECRDGPCVHRLHPSRAVARVCAFVEEQAGVTIGRIGQFRSELKFIEQVVCLGEGRQTDIPDIDPRLRR